MACDVPRGFTLIELAVVMAIIGVLVSLMLPAVQQSREMARRAACANNLHNQVLAVQSFHASWKQFPAGRLVYSGFEHSWCLEVLGFLEQSSLANAYDRRRPWQAPPDNLAIADTELPVFRCPSSLVRFPGDTDYGGIMGSILTSENWREAINNGVMIEVRLPGSSPLTMASITDGTSQTILLAESSDRGPTEGGRWISGYNCFSHDNGTTNPENPGEIYSRHVGGAYVGFADGSTRFLTKGIDKYVVGALCTRDHGEVIDAAAY